MADAHIGKSSPGMTRVTHASPENRNSFIEACAGRLKVARREQMRIATAIENARDDALVERLNDSFRDAN